MSKLLAQIVLLQQPAEPQQCHPIGQALAAQVDADEAAQGRAVQQCFLAGSQPQPAWSHCVISSLVAYPIWQMLFLSGDAILVFEIPPVA